MTRISRDLVTLGPWAGTTPLEVTAMHPLLSISIGYGSTKHVKAILYSFYTDVLLINSLASLHATINESISRTIRDTLCIPYAILHRPHGQSFVVLPVNSGRVAEPLPSFSFHIFSCIAKYEAPAWRLGISRRASWTGLLNCTSAAKVLVCRIGGLERVETALWMN